MKKYGSLPTVVSSIKLSPKEMMFYQYLPIKMAGFHEIKIEPRLEFIMPVISVALGDFEGNFGIDKFWDSYVYLTGKYMFQSPGCSYNRSGWHTDGFMTDDINYIWYDSSPTVFNTTEFILDMDDERSLIQMERQADFANSVSFPNQTLLRLDQYNVHKVNSQPDKGMRLFVKISFSKDKYDLEGNSHNHLFDYNWEMRPRNINRNIPQSTTSHENTVEI